MAIANIAAVVAGSAGLVAAPTGIGHISANMDIMAHPTPYDIAQAVWALALAGFTADDSAGKRLKDAEKAAKTAVVLSA